MFQSFSQRQHDDHEAHRKDIGRPVFLGIVQRVIGIDDQGLDAVKHGVRDDAG